MESLILPLKLGGCIRLFLSLQENSPLLITKHPDVTNRVEGVARPPALTMLQNNKVLSYPINGTPVIIFARAAANAHLLLNISKPFKEVRKVFLTLALCIPMYAQIITPLTEEPAKRLGNRRIRRFVQHSFTQFDKVRPRAFPGA